MSIVCNRKLNIAMVCDAVMDGYLGGCLISTKRFAELLVARGHKVIFITGKSGKDQADGFHGPIEVWRFRSVVAPYFDGQLHLGLPTSREIRKRLRDRQVDVVHILMPMPSGLAALHAARALRLPIVMHSHTQPENIFYNASRFLPKRWLNRLFYRYMHWFYRQGNMIIFPTEFSRQRFSALMATCSTTVISNGVNTDIFKGVEASAFYERFNLSRGKKNLLFVGRLHPEKNLETLVRAAPLILRQHPHTHFFLVGTGYEDSRLQRLARELGVADQVTFLGRVSDEDLVLAYNACDLFVLPSLAELEGMAVLEAMACGKPILVANATESASVHLVDGNGLLFQPTNHEDLASQANRLLSDPTLLRAMGERSLERSRRHDIKESVSKLETLYYSLVSR